VSYMMPDIDSFWHAQSSIMLVEKRLPLHITVLYPIFYYVSFVAASALNLKKSEPLAGKLLNMLTDVKRIAVSLSYTYFILLKFCVIFSGIIGGIV
jgi:hypothetical protein